jgi:hypothetical protein
VQTASSTQEGSWQHSKTFFKHARSWQLKRNLESPTQICLNQTTLQLLTWAQTRVTQTKLESPEQTLSRLNQNRFHLQIHVCSNCDSPPTKSCSLFSHFHRCFTDSPHPARSNLVSRATEQDCLSSKLYQVTYKQVIINIKPGILPPN